MGTLARRVRSRVSDAAASQARYVSALHRKRQDYYAQGVSDVSIMTPETVAVSTLIRQSCPRFLYGLKGILPTTFQVFLSAVPSTV